VAKALSPKTGLVPVKSRFFFFKTLPFLKDLPLLALPRVLAVAGYAAKDAVWAVEPASPKACRCCSPSPEETQAIGAGKHWNLSRMGGTTLTFFAELPDTYWSFLLVLEVGSLQDPTKCTVGRRWCPCSVSGIEDRLCGVGFTT
jgi:hypothetical protein